MPRLKRRETHRRENTLEFGNLSLMDHLNFIAGHTSNDSDSLLTTEDTLQIAWETNRETMLTLFEDQLRAIDNHGRQPGEMPACWWRFESPGERLICGLDPYHAPAWTIWHTLESGETRKFGNCEFIENIEHEESEACFLIRHGIMEDDERAMLSRRHAAIRQHVASLGVDRCNCRLCATAAAAGRFLPLEQPTREQERAFEIEQELFEEIIG
jgi:hypothetical protein